MTPKDSWARPENRTPYSHTALERTQSQSRRLDPQEVDADMKFGATQNLLGIYLQKESGKKTELGRARNQAVTQSWQSNGQPCGANTAGQSLPLLC